MHRFFEYFEIEYSPELDGYYQAAERMVAEEKDAIFRFEHLGLFTYLSKPLATIRDQLLCDDRNLLYCYFLHVVIQSNDMPLIERICIPKRSAESELYDTLPLFALLQEVPAMRKKLADKGVPADVIDATCGMFENQIQDHIDLYGRIGISVYVTWMLMFIKGAILRIGRFNFELQKAGDFAVFCSDNAVCIMPDGERYHRSGRVLGTIGCEDVDGAFDAVLTETEAYYEGYPIVDGLCTSQPIRLDKKNWKKVMGKGDPIVSVHIPSGGPLNYESDSADFARAEEIITKALGEFRLFYCNSWLLDPQLKKILGKETNLTRFADRFIRFPAKSFGKSVFTYLYLTRNNDPALLPERTSMQRAVKRHLMAGGHIYGAKGIVLKGAYSNGK
ncbi:MAG: DUF5596 domain-containing protein [Clostridia bacterium]|nr:DUF5596 domain-containing protein [Clostridia bacterium]